MRTPPKNLSINGNILPWVTEFKYLGVMMSTNIEGMKRDILTKRAQYIENLWSIAHSAEPGGEKVPSNYGWTWKLTRNHVGVLPVFTIEVHGVKES